MDFDENRQYPRSQGAALAAGRRRREGRAVHHRQGGQPLVKVVPIDAPAAPKRLGFMRGAFTVPDDFDTMGQEEIGTLFNGEE
jgi:hypothetical protein